MADQLAQRLGIDSHYLIQAQAGTSYVLLKVYGERHSAFHQPRLIQETVKLLVIPEGIIQEAIAQHVHQGNLIQ